MKVKNQHSEYKDWKTKAQWQKLGKVVIDENKFEEMWPTQAHCQYGAKFYKYYGPDNVRDINEGKPKQGELGL